jgi:hypothetical protein
MHFDGPPRLIEEESMAIRALSLREFDAFNATRARVARHTDQAVEWFADDTETVLGAIAYHHLDLDWSFVVLRRHRDGTFRVSDRAAGFRVLDDARRRLLDTMETACGISDPVVTSRATAA